MAVLKGRLITLLYCLILKQNPLRPLFRRLLLLIPTVACLHSPSYGLVELRGGFASGGSAVSPSYTIRGMFTEASRANELSSNADLDSGPLGMLDFSYAGPQELVLLNPGNDASFGDLTEGEVFFHAGLTALDSDLAFDLYERRPLIIERADGLAFRYFRSGAAKHAMDWSYEYSFDLQNWIEFSPAIERVSFNASRNLSEVMVDLPVGSPVFVRIRLHYNTDD